MYQATVKIKITGYKVLSFTGLYYEDYKKRPNLKKIKEEVVTYVRDGFVKSNKGKLPESLLLSAKAELSSIKKLKMDIMTGDYLKEVYNEESEVL